MPSTRYVCPHVVAIVRPIKEPVLRSPTPIDREKLPFTRFTDLTIRYSKLYKTSYLNLPRFLIFLEQAIKKHLFKEISN